MKKNISILMELRPALEGHAGIPQETRLLYSLFNDLDGVRLTGLINSGKIRINNLIWGGRHNIIYTVDAGGNKRNKNYVQKEDLIKTIKGVIGSFKEARKLKNTKFIDLDKVLYRDLLWHNLFHQTLSVDEFNKILDTEFMILNINWGRLHKFGLIARKYPVINTSGYDFFLSQTPCPVRVSNNTRLLIRYHDSIPIYLPHIINNTKFHQASHYCALRYNINNNAFLICSSHTVKEKVLRLFPNVENNTFVIHDIVSDNYYKDRAHDRYIKNIFISRINKYSFPDYSNISKNDLFYRNIHNAESLKYILVVSTIEPRKNHISVILAWEKLISEKECSHIKLVFVGGLGWKYEEIMDRMKFWQEIGGILHLSNLTTDELRTLYSGAEMVVCPSVEEGFDLTGIEAMLCETMVVASDINVHKEVYDKYAIYFKTYSHLDLYNKIKYVLNMKESEKTSLCKKALTGQKILEKRILWKNGKT